jgi:phosphate starvation-inducible protein PhoH
LTSSNMKNRERRVGFDTTMVLIVALSQSDL